jgi:hypothetical protein
MFSPGSRLPLSEFEFLRSLENSQEILRGTAGRADPSNEPAVEIIPLRNSSVRSYPRAHRADRGLFRALVRSGDPS